MRKNHQKSFEPRKPDPIRQNTSKRGEWESIKSNEFESTGISSQFRDEAIFIGLSFKGKKRSTASPQGGGGFAMDNGWKKHHKEEGLWGSTSSMKNAMIDDWCSARLPFGSFLEFCCCNGADLIWIIYQLFISSLQPAHTMQPRNTSGQHLHPPGVAANSVEHPLRRNGCGCNSWQSRCDMDRDGAQADEDGHKLLYRCGRALISAP